MRRMRANIRFAGYRLKDGTERKGTKEEPLKAAIRSDGYRGKLTPIYDRFKR